MKNLLCFLLLLFVAVGLSGQPEAFRLSCSELPPLPSAVGMDTAYGLAGPLTGTHQGALIVAGGANFPEAPPWRGGQKVWRAASYILSKKQGKYRWQQGPDLPQPVAYGQSASTPQGVFHAGGTRAESWTQEAFLLQWQGDSLHIQPLPPLPHPLAYGAATYLQGKVYLAGGFQGAGQASSKVFLAFDLKSGNWDSLPPWPGPGRILPALSSQNEGDETVIYLSGGRQVNENGQLSHLKDHYAFSPKDQKWTPKADLPLALAGAYSAPLGAHHLILCGGDDGRRTFQAVALGKEVARLREAKRTPEADSLEQTLQTFWEAYPEGFSSRLFFYHTLSDQWLEGDSLAWPVPITSQLVPWEDDWLLPSGELRPGVRTDRILQLKSLPPQPRFSWLDYFVLGLYLLVLVLMGAYFARRENSTEDFFKAGGRIPAWAAGLSILGTSLSAITFMAVPAKTYATDWLYFVSSFGQLLVVPIVAALIIPYLRRQNVTTAYEYLETRFNLSTRLLGGLAFLLFQFGRIGIVLFLPALPLALVTGIDLYLCIILVAVLSILYTVLGGIEAVIWTDVLQVVVLVGGAIFCLVLMAGETEGGLGGLWQTALQEGKLRTFDFSFDFSTPSFWVVLGGGLAANLISQSSDQAMVQRYLSTRDERAAVRSLWIFGLTAVPVAALFYLLGSALFVFFQNQPLALSPSLPQADAILPWYIVSQLPAGLAGLLVAGIFAASMSSLDSSLNSVATVLTSDFYRRFRPGLPDQQYLRFARLMTVLVGLAGLAFALLMAGYEIKSLWDEFSKVLGLFAGGLAGLFFLGMTQKRADGRGALIGFVGSAGVQYVVSQYSDLHFLLYTFTGLVSCYLIGWLASGWRGE